ncbi:hypothetical protein IMSHALPRED_010683 [Imshaugia aleurites]|uniref:Xylanolytic transcriptional activator regulatory domain-containing protein n=1 Tax=Imshaugia aleurites TaxID=172621 RepID=A0A8H3ESW3_9LECA|nr:hypothetical protein IMSHALPRED_010683 [Imshaugia aleurites]
MDEDTRRLPAVPTNSTNNGAASNNNGATHRAGKAKAEDHVNQVDQVVATSPGTASESSSKQQRRRNKPSLSCETCTDGTINPAERPPSRSSTGSSPTLLSNVPFSHPTASNIFKAEHPFSNYWTRFGGLKEVIGVLPSKDQADILIAKYFDVIDPVYPMIHRESFLRDYNLFWSLAPADRPSVDGSLIALIFVMLAMGTQFVTLPSSEDKEQTAEFYVSASHQALKVFSYLGRPSLRVIQTMVLIIYFLMNDNHAADAWAFAGILIRQAYALGLNRDPSIITPHAHPFEKQQRRKVWQAVLFQDTFLTVILKLPPTATHTDVRVEDLALEVEESLTESGATVYADEHEGLDIDVQGTLDAAHEAINSFFLLRALFEEEAMVWYHFQHRAFSEALVIAELVKNQSDNLAMDPLRMRAKNDVLRMIGILQLSSGIDMVARTRVSVLSKYL